MTYNGLMKLFRSVRSGSLLNPAILAAGFFACGDSGGAAPDAAYSCDIEDRDDTFAVGLEKVAGTGLRVQLLSAVPAPPARGDNTWQFRLLDAAAQPIAGASIEVTPFMPDHRHGSSIVAVVSEQAEVGVYEVTPINLWMPGLWEVTFDVTPAGGTTDEVVFRFCIPG
jgi:hypothetical protein